MTSQKLAEFSVRAYYYTSKDDETALEFTAGEMKEVIAALEDTMLTLKRIKKEVIDLGI